jgi:hypothetical protein
MTLQQKFAHELNQPVSGAAAAVTASDASGQLHCDIIERDTLAVSFNRLSLKTSALRGATPERLQRTAQTLSERLTYLMEPISPIEIDQDACVVQMRSNPPQRDDDGRSYYEIIVRAGGQIALTRYRKENGASRQPVPAHVTREVLLRLVDDFCVALA